VIFCVTACRRFPQAALAVPGTKGFGFFIPLAGAWESGGQFAGAALRSRTLATSLTNCEGHTRNCFWAEVQTVTRRDLCDRRQLRRRGGNSCFARSAGQKSYRQLSGVDWSILPEEQKKETSNKSYAAYIREAFGNGYRLSEKNWNKLRSGTFYNPVHHVQELTPAKILIFPRQGRSRTFAWRSVNSLRRMPEYKLRCCVPRGHLSPRRIVPVFGPDPTLL